MTPLLVVTEAFMVIPTQLSHKVIILGRSIGPAPATARAPTVIVTRFNNLAKNVGVFLETIADEIIDAELGDFCWDARIAELHLGVIESIDDDETEVRAEVRILGYFRGQYLVATCIVDGEHRLQWMPKVRHYDGLSEAENAFLDAN